MQKYADGTIEEKNMFNESRMGSGDRSADMI